MKFVGKVCPYCKSEIREDDDVVICSECEMPHHKECWIENKGCTTFGCTGTIMGINSYNVLHCENCGADYIEGEKICHYCGNTLLSEASTNQEVLNSTQYSSQSDYNSYSEINNNADLYNIDEEMNMIIEKNQEYYSKKFTTQVTWNWASAFLGGYWYAYRKMYLFQFFYYLIGIFGGIIPGMQLILFVLSGLFGNYLYRGKVEKYARIAKSLDGEMKQEYIRKKRGTSNGAVWVIIVIKLILLMLMCAALDSID